jgi:hypothetical protein
LIALLVAIVTYGVGYWHWYLGTPLGRAPQLDAAENLVLAGKIATGTLPHEPFYRAMFYPAVLAVPLKLGVSTENLPAIASIFGLFCHFAITLGVARLAARLWLGPREKLAAWFAAALWGFNPVALFYAMDVLDTVPSLALAVWALVWWSHRGQRKMDALMGGVLLGLAVAARPHFLPMVFIAPIIRGWLSGRWKLQGPDAVAWVGAAVVLLLLGMVQVGWSGQFCILPAQGPYNFYAANRPGANGRYYTQQIYFDQLAPGENPAQKEEAILYAKVHLLNSSPESFYWNQRALSSIRDNPSGWLKLMAKKTYYLLNNFDQYNNKTFAWHQAESPWMRWNFLGWGILLVLSVGVLTLRGGGQQTLATDFNCPILAGVMLTFGTYAAGVLLYYASGRFRLPLTPLLCVIAGGWVYWPGREIVGAKKTAIIVLIMFLTSLFTFSNFFHARDESTFIQDELLSANAAAQIGADAQAYRFSVMANECDPARVDAQRILAASYFNLSLAAEKGFDTMDGWKRLAEKIKSAHASDSALFYLYYVALWKSGQQDAAEKGWEEGVAQYGLKSTSAQALGAAKILHHEPVDSSLPTPDPALVKFLDTLHGF